MLWLISLQLLIGLSPAWRHPLWLESGLVVDVVVARNYWTSRLRANVTFCQNLVIILNESSGFRFVLPPALIQLRLEMVQNSPASCKHAWQWLFSSFYSYSDRAGCEVRISLSRNSFFTLHPSRTKLSFNIQGKLAFRCHFSVILDPSRFIERLHFFLA